MRRFKSTNRKPRRSRRAAGRRALAGLSRRRRGGRRRVLASSTNEKIAEQAVTRTIESIDVNEAIRAISKENSSMGSLYHDVKKKFQELLRDYLHSINEYDYVSDLEQRLDDANPEDMEDTLKGFLSEMKEGILRDIADEFESGEVLVKGVISSEFCLAAPDYSAMLRLSEAARPLYPQIKKALKREGYPDIDSMDFMRVVLEGFGMKAFDRLDDTVKAILDNLVDDLESSIEDAYLHDEEHFPSGDDIDSQIDWTFETLDMHWCYSLAREVCR